MSTAVLLSGGLDSAVLLAEEATRAGDGSVQPIYVSAGLAWEPAERALIAKLLERAPLAGRVRPLASLTVDMRDVYAAAHWAVEGRPPGYHTPDEDVYLPGRNIVLLAKAAILCAALSTGSAASSAPLGPSENPDAAPPFDRLVIGTLAHNPFPDATVRFSSAMAEALSLGLGYALAVDAPFAAVEKAEVIRRGVAAGVPLELTLSCMNPLIEAPAAPGTSEPRADSWATGTLRASRVLHCGLCSKCRERHDAFLQAGVEDRTPYADRRYVGA